MIFNVDCEGFLDKHDQLHDAHGVDHSGLEKGRLVGMGVAIFAEEEILCNKVSDFVFDVARCRFTYRI